MAVMARLLALAVLAVPAAGENPVCSIVGLGYSDRYDGKDHTITTDAMGCQENCKRTADCALFTWYPDTGGCWLQQADAKENITFPGVVSGPVRCPGELVTATLSPEKASAKGKVVESLNSATGAQFPWWGWVLIGLGIAACGLCILSITCCQQGRKKSKRSQKVSSKKEPDVEMGVPEASPLIAGAAAAPVAGAVAYAGSGVYTSSPQVIYPQAAPVMTSASAPMMAAPVMTAGTAAPIMTAASAPVQYVVPATQGGDLFTQLDANGDGQLSPEEFAALQARAAPAMPAGYTQVQP